MGIVYAKELNKHSDLNQRPYGKINQEHHNDQKRQNSSLYDNDDRELRKKEHIAQSKQVELQAVKARVDKIHVDGLMRTKDDIVKSQVKELFKAHNFQDVIMSAYKVKGKLEGLGCFKNIVIYIDTSQGPDATPEGVEVTFTVHELRRLTGSVSTMFGNNEGSLLIGARAPNLFGRGERLQMELSHGSNTSNKNISIVKPFVDSWLHTVLSTSIFSTSSSFPWSGYNQKDNGILIDVALNPDGVGMLKHNFQYEATYRKISAAKHAAFSVREQCGPNLKSSLRHILSIDKRDSTIFPISGSLVQFLTEAAGFGGDIGFFKNEFTIQTNWTPHEWITFQLGLQCGLLRNVNNDMKINIADHFFLGGPMNLRGFEMRGCGPRDEGSSLGGNAYWATALHVYTPLPFRPGRNSFGDHFRLHGFINGGNVSNIAFVFDNGYKEYTKIFTEDIRCSVGGGLAMMLGNFARVELNLVTPLLFVRGDVLKQFQFGIGVQYL
ncbi:hypothetical protein KM043_001394 [Ampulex compressa]|nr:hypothetical protein KM043_001394 [Ampulex compressa]